MTRLSDTQPIILCRTARHEHRTALTLPKIRRGGAAAKKGDADLRKCEPV
ncbi:hypothetical protein [uncultured Paracoccus sp.]|nr:hypothetical protein [uncultured Paracoccus sp.]